MDSPLTTRIFRRLFAHETCSLLRYSRTPQRRAFSPSPRIYSSDSEDQAKRIQEMKAWRPRYAVARPEQQLEFSRFPLVTAEDLRSSDRRPKKVKMLLRDFIEDSLYNPHYGYFPNEAVIFTPGTPFNFRALRDEPDFEAHLAARYESFEDSLDAVSFNENRQLWHTPVELFKPYYGEALARWMATNYKLTLYPYYDLLIYEMGAGNGTLMLNVLDYLAAHHPEVYERTQYRVIEISAALAAAQRNALLPLRRDAQSHGHAARVRVVHKSVFDWDEYVASPCFFLALEVFDNFAHDAVALARDGGGGGGARQCRVVVDALGDYYAEWADELDPQAAHFLQVREVACGMPMGPAVGMGRRGLREWVRKKLEGLVWWQAGGGMGAPEYIPTRMLQFFHILHNYFPGHRLFVSDFNMLPTLVPGVNAPVVQTRFRRKMVSVDTPLVHQGQFDIMFPTDFHQAQELYRAVTGKFSQVVTQPQFLREWADVHETRTRNGENPLLNWYKNASVMVTI